MAQRTKHLQILQHNFMNGGSHTLSNSFKYEHNDQEMQNDLLFRIENCEKIGRWIWNHHTFNNWIQSNC